MIAPTNRASALRNGYLVRHRGLNLALRAYDASLAAFHGRERSTPVAVPRRLLLCVGGHLGDAVIATTILGPLKSAYPDVMIGVLAPSWSLPVFEDHPAIRWRHTFDHWKTNRSTSAHTRWAAYRRTAHRARAEIGAIEYDAAVDLYPYFPNAARILSDCGIPARIGYTSGGGGPLYSHPMPWQDDGRHTAERHHALLRSALPDISAVSPQYDLPPIRRIDEERARSLLQRLGVADRPYVVVHPGTGDQRKQWPAGAWRALIQSLRRGQPGLRVVFTGHGNADAESIRAIRDGDETLRSVCSETNFGMLRHVLAQASLLIGVDSFAAHLAAAHDVPCIVIMAAMSDPVHWRPLGENVHVLTNAVPCAPCFRSKGCAAMSCVRGVTVDAVERLAIQVLRTTSTVPS